MSGEPIKNFKITQKEWDRLSTYLPQEPATKLHGRPLHSDPRGMVTVMVYKFVSGTAWSKLPCRANGWPSQNTVYHYYRRIFSEEGRTAVKEIAASYREKLKD